MQQPAKTPIPPRARAKLARLIARYELVLQQIEELEAERDEVLEQEPSDDAEAMIQRLCTLKGVGAQSATVLVREGFVRHFRNSRALGSHAGLTGMPWASGGSAREQGISKAGNRHLRTVMVELAWLWRRWQPDSALSRWIVAPQWRRRRKVAPRPCYGARPQTADRTLALCLPWCCAGRRRAHAAPRESAPASESQEIQRVQDRLPKRLKGLAMFPNGHS